MNNKEVVLQGEQIEYSREEVKTAIEEWIAKEGENLPDIVRHALTSYISLLDTLDAKSAAMRKLMAELRKCFGIVPKSEKRTNYGNKGKKKSRRQRLVDQLEESQRKARKNESNAKKHRRKMKEIEAKLKNLDEIELTEEELHEIEENDRKLQLASEQGGETIDPACALSAEDLLQGLVANHEQVDEDCLLEDDIRKKAKRIFFESRQRLDLEINVVTKVLHIEKAEIEGPCGLSLVSASTEEIGPPKMSVTWNFLSQMTILVGQYGMPLSRFAALVSTPDEEFGSDRAVRYFQYVARRLCGIYLYLARQLSNSSILCGDDTKVRVLEVNRALAQGTCPWDEYSDREKSQSLIDNMPDDEVSLGALIGSMLNFVSFKKDTNENKKSFNTTIVHGRSDENDPKSTIILFRSHFGGFGNLISQLLQYRDQSNSELTILSDLSTVNLIESEIFNIKQAGCTSHARRRFSKNEDEDKDWAGLMLSQFGSIYAHEELLDIKGRNKTNTIAVRQDCSKQIWDQMHEDAQEMTKTFSSATGLGDAARYLIKHFNELTLYLSDPRLRATNDVSERLLRPEKQIQAVALFRESLQGRFALDIVRTVIQTCVASTVNGEQYLNWVLKADPRMISQNPAAFTPFAFLSEQ